MMKLFFTIALSLSFSLQALPVPTGSLRIVVYDYGANTPIANAVVCIPELNGYYLTDENGNSTVIDIPIEISDAYDSTHPKRYGEVTLLVYKKGYIDYVRYNVKVNRSISRLVAKIYLNKTTAENQPPQISSELPEMSWTADLIRKYKR